MLVWTRLSLSLCGFSPRGGTEETWAFSPLLLVRVRGLVRGRQRGGGRRRELFPPAPAVQESLILNYDCGIVIGTDVPVCFLSVGPSCTCTRTIFLCSRDAFLLSSSSQCQVAAAGVCVPACLRACVCVCPAFFLVLSLMQVGKAGAGRRLEALQGATIHDHARERKNKQPPTKET